MSNILILFSVLLNIIIPVFTPETIPTEPGTYNVKYYYDGEKGQIETVAKVTIGSENFFSYEDIAIDANDIYTTRDQELTPAFLFTSSKVKVWNMQTDEKYKVDEVSVEMVNEDQYKATFVSVGEISTTINVYIIERDELYKNYLQDADDKFNEHYIDSNFSGFIFVVILLILFISVIIMYFLSQHKARKQLMLTHKLINK